MVPQRALWSVPTCLLLLSVRLARQSYVPVGRTCPVGNLAYFEMTGYTLSVTSVSDADQVVRHTPEACQQACRDHTAFLCVSYAYHGLTSVCVIYKYRPGEGGAVLQVPLQSPSSYTYYVSYCEQTTAPTGSVIGCDALDLNVVRPSFAFTSINKMTPQYCHRYCLYFTQSTYSGVWGGSNCHCGDTLASGAASQFCSSPCTGDGAQTCGGFNSIQVYATCDKKKFGAICDQSCNCVDQDVCPRTTGACTKPCPAGYGGFSCQEQDECQDKTALCSDLCQNTAGSYTCSCPSGKKLKADGHICETEVCPVGKWGTGCGSDCSANCEGGTCASDTGTCTQCIEGYTGDTCMDTENANQTPNSGCAGSSSWVIPTILLVVAVLIAAIVITILLKQRSSRTRETPSEHPEQGNREKASQGAARTPLGRDANTVNPEQAQVTNGAYEGAYEEIENRRTSPSEETNPDHPYYNVQPSKNVANYDKLIKDEIETPVVSEYERMNI